MPAGIAVLQPPGYDLIQSRTGNNAKLPELRYCPRESPT